MRLHHFHSSLPVDMVDRATHAHHAQGDCSELHCTIIGRRVDDQSGLDLLLILSSVIGCNWEWDLPFNGVLMDAYPFSVWKCTPWSLMTLIHIGGVAFVGRVFGYQTFSIYTSHYIPLVLIGGDFCLMVHLWIYTLFYDFYVYISSHMPHWSCYTSHLLIV